jgi:hypothetical protein
MRLDKVRGEGTLTLFVDCLRDHVAALLENSCNPRSHSFGPIVDVLINIGHC